MYNRAGDRVGGGRESENETFFIVFERMAQTIKFYREDSMGERDYRNYKKQFI